MSKFKELGLTSFKAEGIEMTNDVKVTQPSDVVMTKPKLEPNTDELKAEDIVQPMSVLEELDEDDILYWATPYYDDIQARKQAMQEAKANGTNEI